MTRQNIRIISSWPDEENKSLCGVAEFARNQAHEFRNLTAEVGRVDVAAMGTTDLKYTWPPVDIIINKNSPNSWEHSQSLIEVKARELEGPTATIVQHEYGIYADPERGDLDGKRITGLARRCQRIGPTIVQIHTLETKPSTSEAEKRFQERVQILKDLSEIVDAIVVPTRRAINIGTSAPYNIRRDKLVHIDHGIRVQELDRKEMKRWAGFEDIWLAVTLGLKSPGKGIHEGIDGWGEFVANSLTRKSRKHSCYLIAGTYHPGFAIDKEALSSCEAKIKESIKKHNLKAKKVTAIEELRRLDKTKYDVVFYKTFLKDETLRRFFGAANVVILPYQNLQQISSGILADSIGSRRAVISTKFPHALDLVTPYSTARQGLMHNEYSRGICYDAGNPEQIAEALEYISDDKIRFGMEDRSALISEQMAWPTVARQVISILESARKRREIPRGRGYKLQLRKKKPNQLQRK